jgi:DNA repair exonuclease SbcCD ATPase subunit
MLTPEELNRANSLLNDVRQRLHDLSAGDAELLFAYRRKLYKELSYDERGKPVKRRNLKARKRRDQGGLCPLCNKSLPESDCVLDRLVASSGYTAENTRLLCSACDVNTQVARGYS